MTFETRSAIVTRLADYQRWIDNERRITHDADHRKLDKLLYAYRAMAELLTDIYGEKVAGLLCEEARIDASREPNMVHGGTSWKKITREV